MGERWLSIGQNNQASESQCILHLWLDVTVVEAFTRCSKTWGKAAVTSLNLNGVKKSGLFRLGELLSDYTKVVVLQYAVVCYASVCCHMVAT